ncbi:proline racemase [Aspergillus pseudonomiae]|uniref:Proline racemase n=1 Tax=Aspergillus pseudonomiae TaxID=1506151 RepID=A0A5N7CT93_9EURO|nr:proline racemase [Aspergillus pseudonomiae]KAB8262248.1 proline racemase [Aspergillus pseudonomiae]KAE8397450.1 proline racemase [Aspergillus pseudonomiae]
MRSLRNISLVCSHCEGEAGDVILGGVLDKPARTMHEKLVRFTKEQDDLRRLLLHEPRGRPEMSVVLVLPPCNPQADAGFLIMAPGDWVPMSGSNTICTVTVLLETGAISMNEPFTEVKLDTAAGLITATAECSNGRCKSVSFDNVPAFVYGLDQAVNIPGFGTILVDIAYGGQWYVIAQAKDLDTEIHMSNRDRLVDLGNRLKAAVLAQYMPTHPENPAICGINNIIISEPLIDQDGVKSVKHTVIVTPGRLDRSPCGTGSSSRLAVLYARGQIRIGEKVTFRSVIDTEFIGSIRGTQKVGNTDAVLPNIQGRAWITGERKVLLDPDDPFQAGFLI